MPKMPHNSIAQVQTKFLEQRIVVNVEREDLSIFYVAPNLPTQTPGIAQNADELCENRTLLLEILFDPNPGFIQLPDIVRR